MKIAISQPTYLPWLGYFDLIDQVDTFVVLDNVQFEKQSWQQRNRIKTPAGLQWLTVPVEFRGRLSQQISDVAIREHDFWRKHLRSIELNYARAPYFRPYFAELQTIYADKSRDDSLIGLNLGLLRWFCQHFGTTTPLVLASGIGVAGKRTELLAAICERLNATEYLSPLGSATYLLGEMDTMTSKSISVTFQNYAHPQYRQLFPPFLPYASALDLLMNEGAGAMEIVRRGRQRSFEPHLVPGTNSETATKQ